MEKVKVTGRLFLSMLLASFLGSRFIQITNLANKNYFLAMLINQIMLLLPSIIYIWIYKIPVKKAIRFNKISGSNVVLCIVFAFLLMPIMTLVSAISLLFSKPVIQGAIQNVVTQYPLIIGVFLIAFVPCVFEETIFRGVLFNQSRKWSILGGIFLSAFLFGLAHMNFNQFSYAFLIGIVFALLIEATDSIVSTMIIHFIINASSVIMSFCAIRLVKFLDKQGMDTSQYDSLKSNVIDKQQMLDTIGGYAVFAIAAAVGAFFIYRAIAKNANRWEHIKAVFGNNKEDLIVTQEEIEEKELDQPSGGRIPWCLVIAITFCIVEMVLNEVL